MADPMVWPVEAVFDGAVAVQAVSTEVRPANPRRADMELVNISNQWIHLGRGNVAVMNEGISLAPNGGTYHIGPDNLFKGVINAIAQGGDKILTISEGYS